MAESRLSNALTSWPYRYKTAMDKGHSVTLKVLQSDEVVLVSQSPDNLVSQSQLNSEVPRYLPKLRRLTGVRVVAIVVVVAIVAGVAITVGSKSLTAITPRQNGAGASPNLSGSSASTAVETRIPLASPSSHLGGDATRACASNSAMRVQLGKLLSIDKSDPDSKTVIGEGGALPEFSGWSIIARLTIGALSSYSLETSCKESPVWSVTTIENSGVRSIVKANPAAQLERRG